jgi:hypothetical protein
MSTKDIYDFSTIRSLYARYKNNTRNCNTLPFLKNILRIAKQISAGLKRPTIQNLG